MEPTLKYFKKKNPLVISIVLFRSAVISGSIRVCLEYLSKFKKFRKGCCKVGKLYTIGHSTFEPAQLIDNLRKYKVDYLLDVRSIPYSQFAPQYNKENLEKLLQEMQISYFFMGKFFGARQNNREYYPKGYIDFEKFRKSKKFITGKKNVLKGLEDNNIAFMCTEKNPIDCHRTIMVARDFDLDGFKVEHILSDGSLQSQREIDQLLLEMYFPERNQTSLFQEDNKGEVWYINEAYKKQNEKIGYKMEER